MNTRTMPNTLIVKRQEPHLPSMNRGPYGDRGTFSASRCALMQDSKLSHYLINALGVGDEEAKCS